jgi:hypothetical protein
MTYYKQVFKIMQCEGWLAPGCPNQESLERLVQRAGGLFIWAATTCRYIRNGRRCASTRLAKLLQPNPSALLTTDSALDDIYLTVLRASIDGSYTTEEKDGMHHFMRTILGSIAILYSSLSQTSLALLLNVNEFEVAGVLNDLRSILDVPDEPNQPLRLHHASFRDFLLSNIRCHDANFHVDSKIVHGELAKSCLQLMSRSLTKDICDLRLPCVSVKNVDPWLLHLRLPSHLRYACQYWAQHIQHSGVTLDLEDRISTFMRQHLLHWLEALSLLGKTHVSIDTFVLLETISVSKRTDGTGLKIVN